MRLLFDENLSARLVALLEDVYPGSAAAAGQYVLVTKDDDFQRLSVVRGPPPKVVWIRLGSCATSDVARLLRLRREDVALFVAHEDAAFLALG